MGSKLGWSWWSASSCSSATTFSAYSASGCGSFSPLEAGSYKINVDASFDFQSSRFGAAFWGFALCQAILFAISRNSFQSWWSLNSFQLIVAVDGSSFAIPWKIQAVSLDIKSLLALFPSIFVSNVNRSANSCANWLAKHVTLSLWSGVLSPDLLLALLYNDSSVTS